MKNRLHVFLSLVLFISMATAFSLQSQTLKIIQGGANIDGSQALTGTVVLLETEIHVPAGCVKATVDFLVPEHISLNSTQPVQPDNTWTCSDANTNCPNQYVVGPYDLEIESLPNVFDDPNIQNGSEGVSLQVAVDLARGMVCDSLPIEFEMFITYYAQDNAGDFIACGNDTTNTAIVFSELSDNYWGINLTKETEDQYLCRGGLAKYSALVNKQGIGGYDINNGYVYFRSGGEIVDVFNSSGNPVSYEYVCDPVCQDACVSEIRIPFNAEYFRTTSFTVFVQYDCEGCDYVLNYENPVASLWTDMLCDSLVSFRNSDSESFDPNLLATNLSCCGSYSGPSRLTKSISAGNSSYYCPEACYDFNIQTSFNNQFSTQPVPNLIINEVFPVNFEITDLDLDVGNTYFNIPGNTASVTFSNGSISANITVGYSTGPTIVNPNNIDLSTILSGPVIEMTIQCNQDIPAVTGYLSYRYRGHLNSNANTGDIINSCASISDLNLEVCVNRTATDCVPRIRSTLRVAKPGVNFASTIKVNRNEKATVQFYLRNGGTSDLTDGSLSMTIPDDFTYCNNSIRYYYLPNGSVGNVASSQTPDPDVGGVFSISGQQITFTDYDLPAQCLGGKYFFIEFDVLTNDDALANPNTFTLNYDGGGQTNANITVNTDYQVEVNIYVDCDSLTCTQTTGSIARAEADQTIWYRYEVTNKGNVPLSSLQFINYRPRLGDYKSDCSGQRLTNANSIEYGTGSVSHVCGPLVDPPAYQFIQMNCPNLFPDGYHPAASGQKIVSSNGEVLLPGETFSVMLKHRMSASEQVGHVAENDFVFICERDDVPGPTAPLLSNTAKVFVAPNYCGEISDPYQIDCASAGLFIVDTIVNGDSCCVQVFVKDNIYADLFTNIKISANGGELFNFISIANSFEESASSANQHVDVLPEFDDHFQTGTFPVATLCYDPYYNTSQVISAVWTTDTLGSYLSTEICRASVEINCPGIPFNSYWTKSYGGQEADNSRRLKVSGNAVYIASFELIGSVRTPVFSKFDLQGNLIWDLKYNDQHADILDFVLSEDGSFIVAVGYFGPYNTLNSSGMWWIDAIDGHIIKSEIRDNPGRDRFTRITRHSNPVDPLFPYYVLGAYNGGSDKCYIINMNANGIQKWTKYYDLLNSNDEQLYTELMEFSSGDIAIFGDAINYSAPVAQPGYMIKADGSTGDHTLVKHSNDWNQYFDAKELGDGNILAVGRKQRYPNERAAIVLMDSDLNVLHALREEERTRGIYELVLVGDTIVASGLDRESGFHPFFARFVVENDSIKYVDAYRLEADGILNSDAKIDLFSNASLFFATSLLDSSNNQQLYLGSLPPDFSAGCYYLDTFNFIDYNLQHIADSALTINFNLADSIEYLSSDSVDWWCQNECDPDCYASFSFVTSNSIDSCAVIVQFNSTSLYQSGGVNWDFGDGQYLDSVDNPTHIYTSPGIYRVCATVSECGNTFCQEVNIDEISELPSLTCADSFVICAIFDSCYSYHMPLPPFMIGGNHVCLDTTYKRSDQLSLQEPYPIGITTITTTVSNDFGQSVSCSYNLIVETCQPPSVFCPDNITLYAQFNQVEAQVEFDSLESFHPCSDLINSQTHYSGDYFPCGVTEVSYVIRIDDVHYDTCSFFVTVICDTVSTYCGQAAVTCFPGFVGNNPANGIDMAAPVYGIVDIRDRTNVNPGYWSSRSGSGIFHPSHWSANNLGLVFGIAIDNNENVYLSATSLYGCDAANFDAFGPGGASGIYKIDPQNNISLVTTTGAYNVAGTGNSMPNNGGALGNICYNSERDLCYVTNLSDGKIYTIDQVGNVIDQFDPFVVTPVTSDAFAPLGDRPWAIAYNARENKVYYSNWVEDRGRINTNRKNELWSVELNNLGIILPLTERLELELPDNIDNYTPSSYQNYSNPVSDISFGQLGRMLVAERTMGDDCGSAARAGGVQPWSHNARVLEYESVCSGWELTPGHGDLPFADQNNDLKFQLGNHLQYSFEGLNSAGGIDYGYSSLQPGDINPTCDAMVWSSADYMFQCSSYRIYGMQGLPSSGGDECSSWLIDYDGNPSDTDAKIMQGDVEVFKCFDCLPVNDMACCETFNQTNFAGWEGLRTALAQYEGGPSNEPGDYFLYAEDLSGPSWIYNTADYSGDWTNYDGSCICWDFNVFDDGSNYSISVAPQLILFSGTPTNRTAIALFESNYMITEGSGWINVCAPIELGISEIPENEFGIWTMTDGADVDDWNNLLANVSGIGFRMELISNPAEEFGFDNICIGPCSDMPDSLTCPDLTQGVWSQLTTDSTCCYAFGIDLPFDTLQDELLFEVVTPGVEFGSFSTDGLVNNNYGFSNRMKGAIQHDGLVSFCLQSVDGNIPDTIEVEVSSLHYLPTGEKIVLCREKAYLNCLSTVSTSNCFEIVADSVLCNELPFAANGNVNGYEVFLKVKNTSMSDTFDYFVFDLNDDAPIFWNPMIASLSGNGLLPGQTSDWMSFDVSFGNYEDDTTAICFNIIPINIQGNYCCTNADSFCIEVVPCCLPDSALHVISEVLMDSMACCHSIGFSNDCIYNYVTHVEATILTPGVTFGNHTDLDEDWRSTTLTDRKLKFENLSGILHTGIHEDVISFCTNNINHISQTPQEIEYTWYANNMEIHSEIVTYTCQPQPQDTCVVVTLDSVSCAGGFNATITVVNNSTHTISNVAVVPLGNTTVQDYYPQSISAYIAPQESRTYSISLLGSLDDEYSFRIRLFDEYFGESSWCCYQQDLISIDLREHCCPNDLVIDNLTLTSDTTLRARNKIELINSTIDSQYSVQLLARTSLLENNVEVRLGSEMNTDLRNGCEDVQDCDGNSYRTVVIGDQTWMADNLRTTKYCDGSNIPHFDSDSLWSLANNSMLGGYSWYNNDQNNSQDYGALYNWWAVSPFANGGKNVCPNGWHVPTNNELNELASFIGLTQAGKLKSTGTIENGNGLWLSPNLNAIDEFEFSANPSGARTTSGSYNSQGTRFYSWSQSEQDISNAKMLWFGNNSNAIHSGGNFLKGIGICVRCIKDN